MSVDLKLVEKIQKLLALASSPNEHEARLAAEKANELLIRHNLSMQEIESSQPSSYEEKRINSGSNLSVEHKFVITVVCNFFFVRAIIHTNRDYYGKRKRSVGLVGTETNVAVAHYVYDFLIGKYRELWKEYSKKGGLRARAKQSYYLGLTTGLYTQLDKKKEAVEKEVSEKTGTAVAIREDKGLEIYVDEITKGRSHKTPPNPHYNPKAEADGFREGQRLRISRGLEDASGSSGKLLEQKS